MDRKSASYPRMGTSMAEAVEIKRESHNRISFGVFCNKVTSGFKDALQKHGK